MVNMHDKEKRGKIMVKLGRPRAAISDVRNTLFAQRFMQGSGTASGTYRENANLLRDGPILAGA